MPQHSRTFQLIAALTGFLILAGAGLPAGIHAGHDMSIYCETPGNTALATHDHATMTHDAGDPSHPEFPQQQNKDDNSSCHLTVICCGDEQAPAVISVSNMTTGLQPVARSIPGTLTRDPSFTFHSLENEVHKVFPPLFLKNSSFLN